MQLSWVELCYLSEHQPLNTHATLLSHLCILMALDQLTSYEALPFSLGCEKLSWLNLRSVLVNVKQPLYYSWPFTLTIIGVFPFFCHDLCLMGEPAPLGLLLVRGRLPTYLWPVNSFCRWAVWKNILELLDTGRLEVIPLQYFEENIIVQPCSMKSFCETGSAQEENVHKNETISKLAKLILSLFSSNIIYYFTLAAKAVKSLVLRMRHELLTITQFLPFVPVFVFLFPFWRYSSSRASATPWLSLPWLGRFAESPPQFCSLRWTKDLILHTKPQDFIVLVRYAVTSFC